MSAQVYISGGRLITAGGAVFGIPAAGPPPPPSGEENVVKFRSGMYMQSGNPNDQASMNAFSTSWAGNGGKCVGYSAWYKWNLVETGLGVYSFTSVFNDYAYLQSVAPGASFVPQFNWYSNQTLANSNLPSFNPQSDGVPNYIINNPSTYGVGPPTSSSSYGGWCCDSYESPNYNYVRAAYWRTLIQARIVALFNAFGSTIVPDGQGFTVDEHPLFEMVGTSTPTDLDMQTAPNIAADYTYELANQAWLNMLPSLRATMPHTGVFIMPGFGANNFSGGNDPTQQNTLIKAMLTNGIAQSCTDVYTPTQLTYAQNYLVGNNYNGSTGFQTPLLGQIDSTPSVQGDDYPLNTITEILNCSFVTLQASRVFLYSQSSANFNIPGFWNTIIGTINSYSIPTICGELPTMYMIAPQNFVAASTTASSVTLTWTPQPTQTGTNLVYKIYRNGSLINVTASTSVFTYTDTGLSPNTQYTYTINVWNTNGAGPQSTWVALTAVFSYPSFNSSQVVSNSTTSGTNLVNLSGGTVGLSGSTILYPTSIGGHEAAGVWYTTQVNIQAFTCDFTFQQDPGVYGMFFCVQNSNTTTNSGSGTFYGVNAVADANGEGYGAYAIQPNIQIGNSVAINFGQTDMNNQAAGLPANFSSTGVFVSGAPENASFAPCEDLYSIGINLHANNVLTCHVVYDGVLLTMLLTDTVTGYQARRSWPTNIPQILGAVPGPGPSNTGWVGFTGGGVGNGPGGFAGRNILQKWAYYTGFNTRLATPTFNVASGSYAGTQTVTISASPGATIYYTTNGIDPGNAATGNTSFYSGALTVSASQILKAVAVQSGYTDSFVASANYKIGATGLPRINFQSSFPSAGFMSLCGQFTNVSGAITLGTSVNSGGGACWYLVPIDITSFTAVFTLNLAAAYNGSTGLCFVIQNEYAATSQGANSGGPFALANIGPYNGNLMGYGGPSVGGGINQSVAICFDQSNNVTGLYTNGATPTGSSFSPSPVSLNAGHALQVTLAYSGTTLTETIYDTVTTQSFVKTYTINIASAVGASTAYLGFTALNGANSTMQITNWTVA